MKIVMLMTVSADGYIARTNDEAPWSPEEYERWKAYTKGVGNQIVGRRTYDILKKDGDLDLSIQTVVLTHHPSPPEGNTAFAASPEVALSLLEGRGFATALLGGGQRANSAFVDAGRVHEVILDIEPQILRDGIALLTPGTNLQLKIQETTQFGDTLRVQYMVAQGTRGT
jgi:dihydrofolate reductase